MNHRQAKGKASPGLGLRHANTGKGGGAAQIGAEIGQGTIDSGAVFWSFLRKWYGLLCSENKNIDRRRGKRKRSRATQREERHVERVERVEDARIVGIVERVLSEGRKIGQMLADYQNGDGQMCTDLQRRTEMARDGQRWPMLDAKRQRQHQNGDDAKTSGQTDHKEKGGKAQRVRAVQGWRWFVRVRGRS